MQLETERLILRPHTLDDFEDYFGYIMDFELQQLLGLNGVVDRESALETFQWLLDNSEFIALVSKDSGKVIGHISIQPSGEKLTADPAFRGKRGGSISCAAAKAEQGKGFMTEALRKLTETMLQEGAYDYFDYEYKPSNAASKRLQEKLGFHHWGLERLGDEELTVSVLQKVQN